MGRMLLAARPGSTIDIEAEGDAEAAVEALFTNRFDEERQAIIG
jgi:phosphotransferase system HPr-like phosphotransfer protein